MQHTVLTECVMTWLTSCRPFQRGPQLTLCNRAPQASSGPDGTCVVCVAAPSPRRVRALPLQPKSLCTAQTGAAGTRLPGERTFRNAPPQPPWLLS